MNLHLHMGLDNVALKLFDQLPDRHFNLISWDSIIPAYSESDVLSDALELVKRMHFCGKKKNPLIHSFLRFLNLSSRRGGYFLWQAKSVFCYESRGIFSQR